MAHLNNCNEGDECPNDLERERKPSVFWKETDGHENTSRKVENLVSIAVFDFAEREEEIGNEHAGHTNPADDVEKNHIHKHNYSIFL